MKRSIDRSKKLTEQIRLEAERLFSLPDAHPLISKAGELYPINNVNSLSGLSAYVDRGAYLSAARTFGLKTQFDTSGWPVYMQWRSGDYRDPANRIITNIRNFTVGGNAIGTPWAVSISAVMPDTLVSSGFTHLVACEARDSHGRFLQFLVTHDGRYGIVVNNTRCALETFSAVGDCRIYADGVEQLRAYDSVLSVREEQAWDDAWESDESWEARQERRHYRTPHGGRDGQ